MWLGVIFYLTKVSFEVRKNKNKKSVWVFSLTYIKILLGKLSKINQRAKKSRKSEKINRYFARVTRPLLHRLRVARCGSVSPCGSERFFQKNGLIRVYKIFFIPPCGRGLDLFSWPGPEIFVFNKIHIVYNSKSYIK